jgi:putative ABC transport system permease protein
VFRNYLTIALRNIVNHKLFSFINIAGLAVGLACAILITLFLRDELSYDRWIPGGSSLYRVDMITHFPGRREEMTTRVRIPLLPLMKDRLPEVRAVTRISPQRLTVSIGDRKFLEAVLVVDPNFLQVIQLPLVSGDPARVFANPESIVLSQRTAKKYFGEADPTGKFVSVSGVSHDGQGPEIHTLTVTGVFRDLPENTHLAAELILPNSSAADQTSQADKQSWWSPPEFGYVSLAPNADPDRVATQLMPIIDRTIGPIEGFGVNLRASQIMQFHLTPFRELHLDGDNDVGDFKTPGSWAIIYGFAAVGVLISLVACFNFTNLATARATLRAREIALRKTVGATRRQLIVQFLGESLFISAVALMIAVALVELLLPAYNAFLDKRMAFNYLSDWSLLVGMVVVSTLTGIIGGIYPALVLSSFRSNGISSPSGGARAGGNRLRTLLVIFQFSVSIGLGIAAIAVFRQISYAHKLDLGFKREGIVVMGGDSLSADKRESFAGALRSDPGVLGVAFSSHIMFDGNSHVQTVKRPGEPRPVSVRTMYISPEFPELYEMPLLAGRLLAADRGDDVFKEDEGDSANDGKSIVINVSAARQFAYTAEEAIGKSLVLGGSRLTIVGVLADSKVDGLKSPVEPMILSYYPKEDVVVSVRIRGDQVSDTLAFIDKTWRMFAPASAIQRYFLSDVFEYQLAADKRQGAMFGLFVGIAILIACLGLFGLAAFTAERRTKEIGIRKVFGARTRDILQLLLWQFSIPVLIANVFAWPVAYYYLHHWLEGYAFRVTLNPLYFLAAGLTALGIAWLTIIAHAMHVARASPIDALRYE